MSIWMHHIESAFSPLSTSFHLQTGEFSIPFIFIEAAVKVMMGEGEDGLKGES